MRKKTEQCEIRRLRMMWYGLVRNAIREAPRNLQFNSSLWVRGLEAVGARWTLAYTAQISVGPMSVPEQNQAVQSTHSQLYTEQA